MFGRVDGSVATAARSRRTSGRAVLARAVLATMALPEGRTEKVRRKYRKYRKFLAGSRVKVWRKDQNDRHDLA
jgi:hypothetical protein